MGHSLLHAMPWNGSINSVWSHRTPLNRQTPFAETWEPLAYQKLPYSKRSNQSETSKWGYCYAHLIAPICILLLAWAWIWSLQKSSWLMNFYYGKLKWISDISRNEMCHFVKIGQNNLMSEIGKSDLPKKLKDRWSQLTDLQIRIDFFDKFY